MQRSDHSVSAVTVALLGASLIPLVAGIIFDAAGAIGMFVLVAAMYAVMAVTVRFGPETLGLSLEDINESIPHTTTTPVTTRS